MSDRDEDGDHDSNGEGDSEPLGQTRVYVDKNAADNSDEEVVVDGSSSSEDEGKTTTVPTRRSRNVPLKQGGNRNDVRVFTHASAHVPSSLESREEEKLKVIKVNKRFSVNIPKLDSPVAAPKTLIDFQYRWSLEHNRLVLELQGSSDAEKNDLASSSHFDGFGEPQGGSLQFPRGDFRGRFDGITDDEIVTHLMLCCLPWATVLTTRAKNDVVALCGGSVPFASISEEVISKLLVAPIGKEEYSINEQRAHYLRLDPLRIVAFVPRECKKAFLSLVTAFSSVQSDLIATCGGKVLVDARTMLGMWLALLPTPVREFTLYTLVTAEEKRMSVEAFDPRVGEFRVQPLSLQGEGAFRLGTAFVLDKVAQELETKLDANKDLFTVSFRGEYVQLMNDPLVLSAYTLRLTRDEWLKTLPESMLNEGGTKMRKEHSEHTERKRFDNKPRKTNTTVPRESKKRSYGDKGEDSNTAPSKKARVDREGIAPSTSADAKPKAPLKCVLCTFHGATGDMEHKARDCKRTCFCGGQPSASHDPFHCKKNPRASKAMGVDDGKGKSKGKGK